MADIVVEKGDGEGMFSLPEGSACPRVGDVIRYYFEAWDGDKEKWNQSSWDEHKKLHGTAWKVTKVEHHIRRTDINRTYCATWVTVKRYGRSGGDSQ